MQAAILSDITDSQKFNRVKVAKNKQHIQHLQIHHVDIVDQVMHQGIVQCMEKCAPVAEKWATLRRCARAGMTAQFMNSE